MLIRFVVSNFLSFDEEQEFNMIAGNLKGHKEHVYHLPKLDILKASAIYGANGAGKSNLIKAIDFLSNIVKSGRVAHPISEKKFKLNKANREKPTHFEVEYYINGKTYAYGVTIGILAEVIEEWLVETRPEKEDKLIFERKLENQKTTINTAERYRKTERQKLLIELLEENLLKANDLLVKEATSVKILEIDLLVEWFNNLIIMFPSSKFVPLVKHISESSYFKNFCNTVLRGLDTGVQELDVLHQDFEKILNQLPSAKRDEIIGKLSDGKKAMVQLDSAFIMMSKENDDYIAKKLVARHKDIDGNAVDFDFSEESDGTVRLVDFVPAISNIINHPMVVIIDEIDQSLHPALLRALVTKVMNDNETEGQFIFTTHESSLLDLDIFRQDEIWFVEKSHVTGSSQYYSLMTYKPRYDLDIQKGYLKGRFGAIPFLANLNDLNWNEITNA